jgi:hypothetical protein
MVVGSSTSAPCEHGQGNRRLRGIDYLALLVVRLPLAQLLGGLPLVAAEFRDQRGHAGVDADHQPSGFPAFLAAHQQPAGAAGHIGHVGPRWSRIRSRPARRRSQRFWSAATRELRLEISSAMVAPASCSSRTT